jgi:filamentous hemagglutinin
MNCVNCVISTDATLRSNAASALPSGPTRITVLEQQFGSKFAPATTTSIENSLLAQGNGATGVVYGFPPAGSDVAHVFNVVNQNGVIRYLDGQTVTIANPAAYPKLLFMPVKPIGAP